MRSPNERSRRPAVQARRVSPVDPDRLTDDQRAVYRRIADTRGGVAGPFTVLLHLPELADRVQRVGAYLRYEAALPRDVAELAVLVTARIWQSQYEWDAHEPYARTAGIDDDVIDAVRTGVYDEIAAHHLRVTARFVQELATSARVHDTTYAAALGELGVVGMVELTLLVGYYTMLAMTLGGHAIEARGEHQPPVRR